MPRVCGVCRHPQRYEAEEGLLGAIVYAYLAILKLHLVAGGKAGGGRAGTEHRREEEIQNKRAEFTGNSVSLP